MNAPEIIDTKADRYNNAPQPYRYNVTTVVTVTSKQVDLVRKLINEQSELLNRAWPSPRATTATTCRTTIPA